MLGLGFSVLGLLRRAGTFNMSPGLSVFISQSLIDRLMQSGFWDYRLGTAPTLKQSRVLLRAIYNHIMFIIQLLARGGITQPKPETRNPKP